jgi:hypothetical protein
MAGDSLLPLLGWMTDQFPEERMVGCVSRTRVPPPNGRRHASRKWDTADEVAGARGGLSEISGNDCHE